MRLTNWLKWDCSQMTSSRQHRSRSVTRRRERARAHSQRQGECLETRALLTTGPGDLLIYYGYPSLINQAASVSAATAQFVPYEFVVLGAGLEEASHDDHANTQAIVTAPATDSTKFFGYVDLGVSTNNFSIGVLQAKIDNWAATGVNGIFLDDYGYDFGVTRTRQNAVVDYAHGRGLPVVANGFFINEVFGSAVDATFNPSGSVTHLAASDYYLSESYQIAEGSYVSEPVWRAKSDALAAVRATLPIQVLAVTTDDSANVFDQAQFDFAWYSGLLDGDAGVGWGQFEFASGDNVAPYRTPPTAPVELAGSGGIAQTISVYSRRVANDLATVSVNASTHTGQLTFLSDFGDAPDTTSGTGTGNYQTLIANAGPSHHHPVPGPSVEPTKVSNLNCRTSSTNFLSQRCRNASIRCSEFIA